MTKKTKINKNQGLQATQFITERLEDSRRYNILTKDKESVKVRDKKDLIDDQKTIEIVIANSLPKVNDVRDRHRRNARENVYTVPVFYKDGETAFVRVVDSDKGWIHNKTLKRYTSQQIHSMIRLRRKEELVMQFFGKKLFYYQVESKQLPESLREFRILPVTFDYSHIDEDNDAYRHTIDGAVSKTFKLPEEVARITKDSKIFVGKVDHLWRGYFTKVQIPYKENKKGQLFLL